MKKSFTIFGLLLSFFFYSTLNAETILSTNPDLNTAKPDDFSASTDQQTATSGPPTPTKESKKTNARNILVVDWRDCRSTFLPLLHIAEQHKKTLILELLNPYPGTRYIWRVPAKDLQAVDKKTLRIAVPDGFPTQWPLIAAKFQLNENPFILNQGLVTKAGFDYQLTCGREGIN